MVDPISVRGGTDGIAAHCDDLVTTALLCDRAAGDAGATTLRLHAYLAHPDVLAAALFDPGGAAQFDYQLLSALDGAGGVARWSIRCGALGVALRGAALGYLGADRLAESAAPVANALTRLPAADVALVTTYLRTGDPGAAAQRAITTDPALADLGLDAAAALLGAGSVQEAAGLLGRLYPDGRARVQNLGVDTAADAAGPPRSLADVVSGLSRRNDGRPGEVDVRILADLSGTRHILVDVPGTKDWSPARRNPDVTSIATNLRALAGASTSYERGVIEAMHRAGVRPGDRVMLVGHSEGGMVAMNAAIHLTHTQEFQITQVITAGAPVGVVANRVPPGVQVLALENDGDLVPHLDGAENPDRGNVTTVRFHRDQGRIDANHSLTASYRAGAADVDASNDVSVRAFLDGAHGFFTAAEVRTMTFRVTREI